MRLYPYELFVWSDYYADAQETIDRAQYSTVLGPSSDSDSAKTGLVIQRRQDSGILEPTTSTEVDLDTSTTNQGGQQTSPTLQTSSTELADTTSNTSPTAGGTTSNDDTTTPIRQTSTTNQQVTSNTNNNGGTSITGQPSTTPVTITSQQTQTSQTTLTVSSTNTQGLPTQVTQTSEITSLETTSLTTAVQVQTAVVTSIIQVTSDGGVVLVTSTSFSTQTAPVSLSTAGPTSSSGSGTLNDSSSSRGNGFFSNTGAVVGTFLVVGLAAAGLLLGAAFFYLRRKRARALDEDIRVATGGAGAGGAGISRFRDEDDMDFMDDGDSQPSYPQMSQYGSNTAFLAAGAAAAGSGSHHDDPGSQHSHGRQYSSHSNRLSFAPSLGSVGTAGIVGNRSQSDHFYYGNGAEGNNQPGASEWADYVNAYGHPPDEKEQSSSSEGHAIPVDQRLDPRAMLEHMHESNESDTSLADQRDYSRPLRNPLRVVNYDGQ